MSAIHLVFFFCDRAYRIDTTMENEDSDEAPSINFHEMELDDRLLKVSSI